VRRFAAAEEATVLSENVLKFAELLQRDSSLRDAIEKRNLKGTVSFDAAVEVAVELAVERGIRLEPDEMEEAIAVLQAANILEGRHGEPTLRNLPPGFDDVRLGVANKISVMCQSCALPAAFADGEIFERLRRISSG
jgi:hypothetical protein